MAIQHSLRVLPLPHIPGEAQLPPRHGVGGPVQTTLHPTYLDVPVDHLVSRQPPIQAVAGREIQADVVPAGLEESTIGASSCSWRCHLWPEGLPVLSPSPGEWLSSPVGCSTARACC